MLRGQGEKKVTKRDEAWKRELTREEYHILREKGTEQAFTGRYYASKEDGVYRCAACGNPLFYSDTKYDSGSGWPSFYQPVFEENVDYDEDQSVGMTRTEVTCNRCGGHLGHVFEDGPKPTGKRYCVNSAALHFEEK